LAGPHQPGKLPGGDLDTLPDVLGEPAGRADGALILLTLTAYPAGVYDSLSRDGSFAADLPAHVAAFMADAQVPWSVGVLGGAVTDPAWRAKPSWYLVATEDRMIPPPAQPAPFWGLSTQTASDCSPRQISKPDKDALNSASPGVRRHTNPPVQARRNRSWDRSGCST
jgi:hypothetical protein